MAILLSSHVGGTKKACLHRDKISTDVPRAETTQKSVIVTLKIVLFLAFPWPAFIPSLGFHRMAITFPKIITFLFGLARVNF